MNFALNDTGKLKVADSATSSEDRGYQYDASWNLHPMRYSAPVAPVRFNGSAVIKSEPVSVRLSHGVNYRTNNTTLQTFNVGSAREIRPARSTRPPAVVSRLRRRWKRREVISWAKRNQLTSAPDGNCGYDSNDNLVSAQSGVALLGYDAENQLVAVTNDWSLAHPKLTKFIYDGMNRLRLRREYDWVNNEESLKGGESFGPGGSDPWALVAETRYLYDGWRVIYPVR